MEKFEIKAWTEDKMTTKIAHRLGRSRKAVTNDKQTLRFCRPPAKQYRPRKISPKVNRVVIRMARTGLYSARGLPQMFSLDLGVRHAQQILRDAEYLE